MYTRNNIQKRRLAYIFIFSYGLAAILLILIFTVFWNTATTEKNVDNPFIFQAGELRLQKANSLLNKHMMHLQELDQQYASMLSFAGINPGLDSTGNQIKAAEGNLRRDIDSIDKSAIKDNDIASFSQLLSFYKTMLENRRYPDNLQQFVSAASRQLAATKLQMDSLKKQIAEKDSSLAEIANQKSPAYYRHEPAVSSMDYKLLKSENKYLKSQLDLVQPQDAARNNQTATINRKNHANLGVDMKDPVKSGR